MASINMLRNAMPTMYRADYVTLLSKMIANTEKLQNDPPLLIPQEELVADIVMAELFNLPNITIKKIEHAKGRTNLIIKYENYSDSDSDDEMKKPMKSIGFIGSHMDVVPASVAGWKYNPFELTVDQDNPDMLRGRGTTDCLGHVALLTLLLKHLSINNIKLNYIMGVVFIADEENGLDPSIGIPHLAADGELDFLKYGPVYWLDASDIYPTVGSGTGMGWQLNVANKCKQTSDSTNPLIFAMETILEMLTLFKEKFPEHPKEKAYKYPCSSNMKPTQLKAMCDNENGNDNDNNQNFEQKHSEFIPEQWMPTGGSINQIASTAIVQGDIKLESIHNYHEVKEILNEYIANLNANPAQLPQYHEKFPWKLNDNEKSAVKFNLKWLKEDSMQWELYVTGKCGHSGLPYNSINPVIFVMTATLGMLKTFNDKFPNINNYDNANANANVNDNDADQIFKITNVVLQGDVRLIPFYDWQDVRSVLNDYVTILNETVKKQFNIELKWLNEPYEGIACNMESIGFKILSEATLKIHGSMDHQACTGSLPLIADLQKMGFDVQIIGYGIGKVYHGIDEHCYYSHMLTGFRIMYYILMMYNSI